MVNALLDRPIAFHRVFVALTGSVAAALLLSQSVYWSRRAGSAGGWFWKTREQWEAETGLSRREQETARRHLREAADKWGAFWGEEERGMPARLWYRIDENALLGALTALGEEQAHEAEQKEADSGVSCRNETALPVGTKPPYKKGGYVPTSRAENALDRTETTAEITAETTDRDAQGASPLHRNTKAEPIPEDWEPDSELIAYASCKGFDQAGIARETEKFRNYWLSQAGARSKKTPVGWRAAFRSWILRAEEDRAGRVQNFPLAVKNGAPSRLTVEQAGQNTRETFRKLATEGDGW